MKKQDQFRHDVAKYVTNILFIMEEIQGKYAYQFSWKLKDEFNILQNQIDQLKSTLINNSSK